MSTLQRVDIQHVRNLEHISLQAHEHINLIHGANASGKTSLLEAIHVLSSGRSFRTHRLSRILSYGQSGFVISGQISNSSKHQLGIDLYEGRIRLRADGQALKRTSELASYLTSIPIHQESYQILSQGPRYRRQFLDWAVFHVEQSYLTVWKRCYRALKQRNAALLQAKDDAQVWDVELTQSAYQLNQLRYNYFNNLREEFLEYVSHLLPAVRLDIRFYPGWNEQLGLETVLKQGLQADGQAGYTRAGPQRADIRFSADDQPIQDAVSRGQLKLAVTAMLLAQAKVYQRRSGRNCVLMLDDIDAELDESRLALLISLIEGLHVQVFITTTAMKKVADLLPENKRMFHVKHGIIEMV